jgi:hypothetical protein
LYRPTPSLSSRKGGFNINACKQLYFPSLSLSFYLFLSLSLSLSLATP